MTENINTGRFSSAPWIKEASKHMVLVGGAGGIGSWVTLFLNRIGVMTKGIDYDQIDYHNIGGQLFGNHHIGLFKVKALSNILESFGNKHLYNHSARAIDSYDYAPIMISAFDNMEARSQFFNNWISQGFQSHSDNKQYLFIDGRLTSEQIQIFCLRGDKEKDIEDYMMNQLFTDDQVEDAPCSFKQTSHVAAMIGSLMTGFLTNHFTNLTFNAEISEVPYFHEYFLPLNKTKIINGIYISS